MSSRWVDGRVVVLALGILGAVWPGKLAAQDAPPQNEVDPFAAVGLEFRSMYVGGRSATMRRLGPVIMVETNQLVLIRDGKRAAVDVVPRVYHRLKAVSHAPLALYVALAPYGEARLDDPRLTQLRSFKGQVAAMEAALDDSGFDREQVVRSRVLLKSCLTFLDGVLESGSYDPGALKRLARQAGPIVLANARDAAIAQIDAYDSQVKVWRNEIPDDEWSRLRVVILGPQMPRKHNVAVQYFGKLMNLPGESRRLVYAEELSGEFQALNLLATHQLDSELSEAFFGDRDRMEIDLLGNAASVYLDGLDLSR